MILAHDDTLLAPRCFPTPGLLVELCVAVDGDDAVEQ